MTKKKFSKKIISSVLVLSLVGTTLHCSATKIVPITGGGVSVPPVPTVATTNTGSQKPSSSFSIQIMKSKIDEVINPQKSKAALRDNPSGKCGDNLIWELNTDTGVLTISGTGDMYSYTYYDENHAPWYSNRNFLKSVKIENGVTSIGKSAFYDCSSLVSISIPASVTFIDEFAFYFSALTSINIPNSVTRIERYAFYHCSKLTSIMIPNFVTSVGEGTFSGCSTLTSIEIPKSVTSIELDAFNGCSALTEIKVNTDNTKYKSIDGVLFDKDATTLIRCPQAKSSITIPNSVTSIGDDAFEDCSALTSIEVPNSVISIGDGTFRGCSSLISINIPDSVTFIGRYAFNCGGLLKCNEYDNALYLGNTENQYYALIAPKNSDITSCKINKNTKIFVGLTFSDNSPALTEVTIEDGATSIGDWAFQDCKALTSVVIPDSVTTIGQGAFEYCGTLTSVIIPNSITTIGSRAFDGCTSLTSITLPDSITTIGSRAFNGCISLTSITVPNSVTSIGSWAFSGCSALISAIIGNNVTSIGEYAFSGCSSLTSIDISDSVTSIGSWAFSGCSALISAIIGNNVTSIGECAFSGCSLLAAVEIPDSVTSIASYVFSSCKSLWFVRYLGTSDPGKTSYSVFSGSNKLTGIWVNKDYKDDKFCGMKVLKEGLSDSILWGIVSAALVVVVAVATTVLVIKCKSPKNAVSEKSESKPVDVPLDVIRCGMDVVLKVAEPFPDSQMQLTEEFEM